MREIAWTANSSSSILFWGLGLVRRNRHARIKRRRDKGFLACAIKEKYYKGRFAHLLLSIWGTLLSGKGVVSNHTR